MDMKRAMTTNRQGGSVIPKEGARELGTKSTSFNPHLSVLALSISISSLEFFPVLTCSTCLICISFHLFSTTLDYDLCKEEVAMLYVLCIPVFAFC